MSDAGIDKVFAGSIPEIYDTFLVPLIFEPYATDLARRMAGRQLKSVLEIAAGTGVVTRAMAKVLSQDVSIVADGPQCADDRPCPRRWRGRQRGLAPRRCNEPSLPRWDLRRRGFTTMPRITTLAARSSAESPRVPAIAYCQGTRYETKLLPAARRGWAKRPR